MIIIGHLAAGKPVRAVARHIVYIAGWLGQWPGRSAAGKMAECLGQFKRAGRNADAEEFHSPPTLSRLSRWSTLI